MRTLLVSTSIIFKNTNNSLTLMTVKFICVECGFKSDAVKFPVRCPYCAKTTGLRDNSKGEAQRDIDELLDNK